MAKRRSSPALFELLDNRPDPREVPSEAPTEPQGETPEESLADAPRAEPAPESPSKPPADPTPKPDARTAAPEKQTQASPKPKAESESKLPPIAVRRVQAPKPPEKPLDEPKPEPKVIKVIDDADPEPDATAISEPQGRTIRINSLTIAYALTMALALTIMGYAVGFTAGKSVVESEWAAEEELPRMTDPQIPFDPVLTDSRTPLEPDPPRRSEDEVVSSAAAQADTTPVILRERRTPGMNYLVLPPLPDQSEAERLAVFLESQGVPAQVEKLSGSRVSGWRVVTLHGITGGEYARRLPARTDHEQRVIALGERWLSEAEGSLDFTRQDATLWMKYAPDS